MRQLILAAAIIVAVLTTVWFSQPRLLQDMTQSPPENAPEVSYSSSPSNPTKDSASLDPHEGHDHEGELPPELEEYIESQRIPAEEIPVTIHPDGSATVHTGKQFSTVMMMVIDEDGNRRMVERQITPEGTLVIPQK